MARPAHHRPLTPGETAMLIDVFGNGIPFPRVRIHPARWFWPLPNTRAMAPNGHMYLPGAHYAADYAAPHIGLHQRAIFIHEGAHLYQWHVLGWTVWARGPFDRNYQYTIIPGRAYQHYGLEQMGMIAQHYFMLKNGARPSDLPAPSYTLATYASLLPLR